MAQNDVGNTKTTTYNHYNSNEGSTEWPVRILQPALLIQMELLGHSSSCSYNILAYAVEIPFDKPYL